MYPVSSILSIDLANVTIIGSSLGFTVRLELSDGGDGVLRTKPVDSNSRVIIERIIESLQNKLNYVKMRTYA